MAGTLEIDKQLDLSASGINIRQFDPFATKVGDAILSDLDFASSEGAPSPVTSGAAPVGAAMPNLIRGKSAATVVGIARPYVGGALQFLTDTSNSQNVALPPEFNFKGRNEMMVGMAIKLRPAAEWGTGTKVIAGLRNGSGDYQWRVEARKTASNVIDNFYYNNSSGGTFNLGDARTALIANGAGHFLHFHTQYDPARGTRSVMYMDGQIFYESGWSAAGTTIKVFDGVATIGVGTTSGSSAGIFEMKRIWAGDPTLSPNFKYNDLTGPAAMAKLDYDMNAARLLTGW